MKRDRQANIAHTGSAAYGQAVQDREPPSANTIAGAYPLRYGRSSRQRRNWDQAGLVLLVIFGVVIVAEIVTSWLRTRMI